ncbi:MAG: PD40 domain-containing protein, partial [Bacteroidales bacterium]|nr:PD40 domain-containing protein [Bacteroidales bacterium]
MKELKKIFVALTLLLLVCVGNLSAQYAKLVDSKKYTKAEMSLFNASVGYFDAGDYSNASKGFTQLHSWYPSDPVFCFYCGATMVMLRTEYDKAIKYLLLAYENKLSEADYYIGFAYHNKYLFSKAITHYSRYREYLESTTKGKSPKIEVVRSLMTQAQKGRDIGQYSYVLKVISNSKVKRSNFYFSYGRKVLAGNIVVKPDFFKQKNDKYNKEVDLVYVLDTIAYVSSYGSDMKNGLDIYYSRKIKDTRSKDSTAYIWSTLRPLPGNVNTEYDEAYPFLASDGTLYFASKGHNSIGGYDIFKSVYNSELGIWLEPENLGFPINTPYDDFMYAIEANGKSAFFASDRVSKEGQVMVCRYIVDGGGELIKIESEEELAQNAELPVTPGADVEYERSLKKIEPEQNQDAEEDEKPDVQQEMDTTNLYVSTQTMLAEKQDDISKYQEYSRKLNAYSRMTSEKIKSMRAQGNASVSPHEMAKMANSVVVLYELSQKFSSVHSMAKPTLDYCGKELEMLNKLEKGSGQYLFKLQNINLTVERVNAKSPLDVLIAEKNNERTQIKKALNKSNETMHSGKWALKEIDEKLEAIEHDMQNAENEATLERYASEKKKLEKSRNDIVNNMKKTLVEVKRYYIMIDKLNETINMLESIDEYIASVSFDENAADEDISASDILTLKNYISDEEDMEQREYSDMVDDDDNFYTELYADEYIAGTSSGNRVVTDKVASMKEYVSASTAKLIESMAQTDSLYSEKEKLEHNFDVTKNDEEKKGIISQINSTQAKIDKIEKEMEPAFEYEKNDLVSKAISDYNSMKQMPVDTEEWKDMLSSTKLLINKSNELKTMISDGMSESDDNKVKLLSKIKSDIDNRIVENVDRMSDIVLSHQAAKKDVADLNSEISRIRTSGRDKTAESDVRKDVNSASKKIDEAKRTNVTSASSLSSLSDAENIIESAVDKRIAILNQEYDTENKVYDVLSKKYEEAGRNEDRRQHADAVYYSALEDRQKAETVSDDVEKMRLLSEANKKLKSANSELMQIVAPTVKVESGDSDVLTESIISLHEELENQKSNVAKTDSDVDNDSKNIAENNPDSNGVLSHNNPVNAGGTDAVSNTNADNTGTTTNSSHLKASVSRQEKYETEIATADNEISDIQGNIATADRSEKKRLQTELDEVTSERNGNVRSLGEEKQRFYAEIDMVAQEQIVNADASTEYNNRYADYRQTLYTLTNAEQRNKGNITEKLAETEKSEYALLQTIIPHVDAETKSVLQPIYSKLDEKYGVLSHTDPANAGGTDVDENNLVANTTSVQLKASVS